MAEARINESCIIGLPTCGNAFSSSRMAFIATPMDEEFALELEVISSLLTEKGYESYIALQNFDPAKFAFCTKICSKIITSQFCIVLLNSSSHRDHPDIKMPNPNVHLEYGLMLALKKHILPFQREGDALAFNIRPLDTILYTKGSFKALSNRVIGEAILHTSRPTRTLPSSNALIKYTSVLGLRIIQLDSVEIKHLYKLGEPMGFLLLDGNDIVYLGLFELESAKEVVFRLKLLLEALYKAKQDFEEITKNNMTPKQVKNAYRIWNQLRVEVLISGEVDRARIERRVLDLTEGFDSIPWKLVTENDMQQAIDKAYADIGEI